MNWIDIKKEEPKPNQTVLVVLDYRKWDANRPRRVEMAGTRYSEVSIRYGGPTALIGSGSLKGFYFSLPAIIPKECVTHWMPLPDLPW